MQFKFKGVQVDTDKPLYVYGFTIRKSWFPYRLESIRSFDSGCETPSAKQFFIKKIDFTHDCDQALCAMDDLELITLNADDSVCSVKGVGFGRSPKAAKQMWERLAAEYSINQERED